MSESFQPQNVYYSRRKIPYPLTYLSPDARLPTTPRTYSCSDARLKPNTLTDMTPDACPKPYPPVMLTNLLDTTPEYVSGYGSRRAFCHNITADVGTRRASEHEYVGGVVGSHRLPPLHHR